MQCVYVLFLYFSIIFLFYFFSFGAVIKAGASGAKIDTGAGEIGVCKISARSFNEPVSKLSCCRMALLEHLS